MDQSGGTVSTSCVAIDDDTIIPQRLYQDLLLAGEVARNRSQHYSDVDDDPDLKMLRRWRSAAWNTTCASPEIKLKQAVEQQVQNKPDCQQPSSTSGNVGCMAVDITSATTSAPLRTQPAKLFLPFLGDRQSQMETDCTMMSECTTPKSVKSTIPTGVTTTVFDFQQCKGQGSESLSHKLGEHDPEALHCSTQPSANTAPSTQLDSLRRGIKRLRHLQEYVAGLAACALGIKRRCNAWQYSELERVTLRRRLQTVHDTC